MSNKYLAYGGIAGILNSLQSDNEIKLFLTKYKKWYIKERNLTRWEADEHIKHDIGFLIKRFIRNPELILKLSSVLKTSYS
jgi:hypothetical protein